MIKPHIHITIATMFPEVFPGTLGLSLMGKALKKEIWSLNILNIRHYARKNRVDDKIFGGLPGMLIGAPVIESLIESNRDKYKWHRIFYTNPKGSLLTQQYLQRTMEFCQENEETSLLIICGRYEGIDARAVEYYKMEEFSLGSFILSGGEIAALAFVEGLIRLIPGVIGNGNSIEKESFNTPGYLQANRYTRPRVWKEKSVPEVLVSGHHKNIKDAFN
jgi:tRNA (guanine37-N1)-methyltransferase